MFTKIELAFMASEIRKKAQELDSDLGCPLDGACYTEVKQQLWVKEKGKKGFYKEHRYLCHYCKCGDKERVKWLFFGKTKISCLATREHALALADRIEKAKPRPVFNPKRRKI